MRYASLQKFIALVFFSIVLLVFVCLAPNEKSTIPVSDSQQLSYFGTPGLTFIIPLSLS